MTAHYDLVIIGTGAGGGTLAYKLAPSGKRILLLERGTCVPREKANWDSRAVNVEARYHTRETWRDRDGRALHPHTNYYVGGNTKFYGAALFRMRERDFGELAHHDGVSPAWPLTYADLEPYYTQAERLYHVHGARGTDPTEPWTSGPYAHPPVSHEPRIQKLHDDLARAGLRPFPVPLGVMLDESDPQRSPCIRCETCDGYPCLLHAKSDAQIVCVDPALRYPNVELWTEAQALRLETDPSGRAVTGVVVRRRGEECVVRADVVVVSCGAINSAALLLRSANTSHPQGLANRSGVVGRHYMGHVNSVVLAISTTPNPTVFQKTLGLNDFYFGEEGFPYPMGHISFVGKLDAAALSAGAPPFVPGMTLDVIAKHSLDFWLTSEDLPDPDNRVTLDREGGIVLSYRPNNLASHARLVKRLEHLLEHIGARHLVPRHLFLGQRIPLAGVAHQNGTVRFGHDPGSSALDPHCRAHDVDNLYVVDGSFFPSSSAVNPALTIMANALRVGDHLLDRLGAPRTEVAGVEV
jgi:choline dehydrogenase-like flavoprotein